MTWQVRFDAATRLIRVEYVGNITPAELSAAIRETVRIALQHNTARVLTDCTRMLDGHSAFDLYAALDGIGTSGLASRYHEAVLLPAAPEAIENVRFWETACRNRGIDVCAFEDRDAALAWITAR